MCVKRTTFRIPSVMFASFKRSAFRGRRHFSTCLSVFSMCVLVVLLTPWTETGDSEFFTFATEIPAADASSQSFHSSTFKILAVIPVSKAPRMSRELDEAINIWHNYVRRVKDGTLRRSMRAYSNANSVAQLFQNNDYDNLQAFNDFLINDPSESDSNRFMPELTLIQIPLGNETVQFLKSVCNAVETEKPTLFLSFLEPTKTYYMSAVSETTNIPLVSMIGDYASQQNDIQRPLPRPRRQVNYLSLQLISSINVTLRCDFLFRRVCAVNMFYASRFLTCSWTPNINYNIRGQIYIVFFCSCDLLFISSFVSVYTCPKL